MNIMRIFLTLLERLCIKRDKPADLPHPEPYTLPDFYTRTITEPEPAMPLPPRSYSWTNNPEMNTTNRSSSPEKDAKTAEPLPMMYQKDPTRFTHFSNSFAVTTHPMPVVILPLSQMPTTVCAPHTVDRKMALLVTPRNLSKAVKMLFMWEKHLHSVVIAIEIEMLIGYPRTEEYFIVKQWCFTRNIQLGVYLYQARDHIYVPSPRYRSHTPNVFHFYLLDCGTPDKYANIEYMTQYLLQLGINNSSMFPLYLPESQFPIRDHNCGGYFFREDLCRTYVQRTTFLDCSTDLAFNLN